MTAADLRYVMNLCARCDCHREADIHAPGYSCANFQSLSPKVLAALEAGACALEQRGRVELGEYGVGERSVVVARNKYNGNFAVTEHTGGTIEHTDSVWDATHFGGPVSIMHRMGGHYRSYDPITVRMYYTGLASEPLPYPPPESVFP